MNVMNTKEEILKHLKEILEMEEKAERGYKEIISSIESEPLKLFFRELAGEEETHGRLVRELIETIEKG